MVTFGESLKMVLESKQANKSALCEKLGISRTTLYRFMENKAVMPEESLKLLIQDLMLLPSEIKLLQESYQASLIGLDRYQCRILTEEICRTLLKIKSEYDKGIPQPGKNPTFDTEFMLSVSNKQVDIVNGTANVRMVLKYMLDQTLDNEEIYVFSQPDNEIIMSELHDMLTQKKGDYTIKHCFELFPESCRIPPTPLAANLKTQQNVLYNMFPLDISRRYQPVYIYKHHSDTASSFISYDVARIVTPKYALYILKDCEQALFFSNSDMVLFCRDEVRTLYHSTLPYLIHANYTSNELSAYIGQICNVGQLSLSFEPWMFYARTLLYMDNKENTEAPLENDFLLYISESNLNSINRGDPVYIFFTEEGLERLVKNKTFCDIDNTLMKPMTTEQLRRYLTVIYDCSKQYSNVVPLLLDGKVFPFFQSINLRIYQDLEIRFTNNNLGVNHSFILNEKSIVKAFSDYFFNVYPKSYAPGSKEKAQEALQSAIHSIV